MSQLSWLLALQAILKKSCHSSPGCWLTGPFSNWLSEPYSKNHVTALQAAGSPGHSQKIMSQLSRLLALWAILQKIMSQLSRLLALWAILKKSCHSSPGCWLSGPFSKNHVTALQAAGSPGYAKIYDSIQTF